MTAEPISDREFELFRGLMHSLTGVRLSPERKILVGARLAPRLRQLGIKCPGDYFHHIVSERNPLELERTVDLLTTHETYFFRESEHFDFLARQATAAPRGGDAWRVWSAACASGEESFSIAMVLADRCGPARPWEVLGSDISTAMVDQAQAATYRLARIELMPQTYLQRFCLRGTGADEGSFRIKDALRSRMRFGRINLNDPLPDIGRFDAVFLRNVLIYFAPPTQRRVVAEVARRLKPGGCLVVGLTESLAGIAGNLRQMQPGVWRVPPESAASVSD